MKNLIIFILITSFFFIGCATIVHSNTQFVNFDSEPDGAIVYVDGKHMGTTPAVLELSVETEHEIKIMDHGKVLYQTTIHQVVSDWFWGNFATILPFGMIVDYSTGSMYRLEPDEIDFSTESARLTTDRTMKLVILNSENNTINDTYDPLSTHDHIAKTSR